MFTIEIARQKYSINNHYSFIVSMCSNYLTEGTGIPISVTEEEILNEQDKEHTYPLPYLETLAVYRKIANQALKRNTLLFHGSAVAVDGKAYLFTAASGTGKSTHTRFWRELLGSRAVMINDDKPLLRFSEDTIYVCGTPWDGKHHLSTNIEAPLSAICILQRGEDNQIQPVSFQEAYPILVQQSFRPSDQEGLLKMFELLDRLGAQTRLYHLFCNMSIQAAETAWLELKG